MTTSLRTHALRAHALRVVRGATPKDDKIQLIKRLIERADEPMQLAEYVAAITWAQQQPAADAAVLPQHSVVATRDHAFIKAGVGTDPEPWLATLVSGWRYANAQITELLESGKATVLRVGDGA